MLMTVPALPATHHAVETLRQRRWRRLHPLPRPHRRLPHGTAVALWPAAFPHMETNLVGRRMPPCRLARSWRVCGVEYGVGLLLRRLLPPPRRHHPLWAAVVVSPTLRPQRAAAVVGAAAGIIPPPAVAVPAARVACTPPGRSRVPVVRQQLGQRRQRCAHTRQSWRTRKMTAATGTTTSEVVAAASTVTTATAPPLLLHAVVVVVVAAAAVAGGWCRGVVREVHRAGWWGSTIWGTRAL